MKKSLVVFAFLLLVGLGFTVYFQSSLLSEKDQVTFMDDIIYGLDNGIFATLGNSKYVN